MRRLRYLPFMMLLGIGIAFSNTRAIWTALTDRSLEFVRTPKFGIAADGGAWLGKAYRLRGFWDGIAELCLGVYALCGLWLLVRGEHALPDRAVPRDLHSRFHVGWGPHYTAGPSGRTVHADGGVAIMKESSVARTPWPQLTTRRVYANRWMAVREDQVRLPDGRETIYGVVDCGDCVGVLPLVDPAHVLLVGQYRYVAQRFTWEMPTGGVRPGESLEAAAQRELAEEAGRRANA